MLSPCYMLPNANGVSAPRRVVNCLATTSAQNYVGGLEAGIAPHSVGWFTDYIVTSTTFIYLLRERFIIRYRQARLLFRKYIFPYSPGGVSLPVRWETAVKRNGNNTINPPHHHCRFCLSLTRRLASHTRLATETIDTSCDRIWQCLAGVVVDFSNLTCTHGSTY